MDADVPLVPPAIGDDVLHVLPVSGEPRAAPVAGVADWRTLIALGSGAFVAALVFIIPPLFFPQMAGELRVGVPLLGQTMSVMLGLSVALGLVIGPLSDRSGYRRLIVAGLTAAAICLLVFGLAPVFPLLLVASAAGALTDAGVLGPSFAVAGSAFSGVAATRAIGWTSAAQAGSAIVAVPLLAAVGAAAGWRLALVVAGLAALACVIVAIAWLPHDNRESLGPLRFEALLAPYRPLLRHGSMRRLYAATMLGGVCWFGLLTYLGAFLVEGLGLGAAHVGLVYMVAGAGYFVGSLAVGGPLARVSTRRLVVVGFLTTAVSVALALSGRVGTTGAVVSIATAALAMGMQWVAMTALLTAETPTGTGTTLTLSGSTFNLGAAAGGAIGGLLLAVAGYGALAVGLPGFALGAALFSWRSTPARVLDAPRRAEGEGDRV